MNVGVTFKKVKQPMRTAEKYKNMLEKFRETSE